MLRPVLDAAPRARPAPASHDAHALPRASDRGRGEGARHGGRVGRGLGRDRGRGAPPSTRPAASAGCAPPRSPPPRSGSTTWSSSPCGRRRPRLRRPAAPGRGAQRALVPVGPRHLVAGGGDRDGARRPGLAPAALRARRRHLPHPALPRHALPLRRARRRRASALAIGRLWPGVARQGRRGPPDRPGGERRRRSQGAREGRHRRPAQRGQDDALQRPHAGRGAETAIYPFTTVEPNVAIVEVPDQRLAAVAEAAGASPQVPETIEFHDIAGLVQGASAGEGLGNRFLGRDPRDRRDLPRRPRPRRRAGPSSRGAGRPGRRRRGGGRRAAARRSRAGASGGWSGSESRRGPAPRRRRPNATGWSAWSRRLGRGEPARAVPAPALAPNAAAELQALSSKPVLYVANLDEGEGEPPAALVEHARRQDARLHRGQRPDRGGVGGAARRAEAAEMRAELGLGESGLERLVRAAYELLDLVTFFTAAPRQRGEGAGAAPRARPPGTPPARSTPRSRPASCAPR